MALDPDHPPEPLGTDEAQAMRAVPATDEPPPDAGEPMGADDDRPSMLGPSFRHFVAGGMLTGLVVAMVAHAVAGDAWIFRDENAWSWLLAGFLGLAVGAGLSLFLFGVITDRDDAGDAGKRRGRADVTTEGEERRSKRRLRRREASR